MRETTANLTGKAKISRTDLMDERVMTIIEERFDRVETREEADRAYEFLKTRLERAYHRNLRRVFNDTQEEKPLPGEAKFVRDAKAMFGFSHMEAIRALGYSSYAKFAEAEAEIAAQRGEPFQAREAGTERLQDYATALREPSSPYDD